MRDATVLCRRVIPAPRSVVAKHGREKLEHKVSAAIERMISPVARARWVEQLSQIREEMTLWSFCRSRRDRTTPAASKENARRRATARSERCGHAGPTG